MGGGEHQAMSDEKRYKINEVFYSLQGEGMRAGEASVFVRFSGCNLKCAMEAGPKSPGGFDCDTEFESGRMLTAADIKEEIVGALVCAGVTVDNLDRRKPDPGPWIVFTGGEPGLQLDKELVDLLRTGKFRLAIETNGTINVDDLGLDWITVSPKVAEHALKQLKADEVKYVRGVGQAIPKTRVEAKHKLISPAFDGVQVSVRENPYIPDEYRQKLEGGPKERRENSLSWCVALCKAHPDWRLSIQLHKAWGVR